MALELIAGAVLGQLGVGATKIASAPAEAYAEHWKARIKARLDRTREAAEAKNGGEPLDVNDRVAFKALSEAAINDDPLIADYLGGVLAASGPDDDSGAAVIGQIGRLSAAQLRLHYILYRELRRLWPHSVPLNLGQETEAERGGVAFSPDDIVATLGVDGFRDLGSIIPALISEGLFHNHYRTGPDGDSWSVNIRPSGLGAAVFLWGHGIRRPQSAMLFDPSLEFVMLEKVPATPEARLISPPKELTVTPPS